MNYSEGYGYAKTALGVGSDVYGTWQTGQQYEAQTAAFTENENAKTANMHESWKIQKGAKDQAAFGGFVAADAYLAAGNKKLSALGSAMSANTSQILMQHSIAYEQSAAVDETVGNMMSRNAITSMKAEARLRASAAGTGTSGGSTQIATIEAQSVEMFDNAVLIGRAEGQKLNIQRRLSMDRLSSKNKQLYIASQMGSVFSATGAGAAFEKGKSGTYAGISDSRKQGYVARDVVQARNTKTWADTFFKAKDIFVNSGGDDATTKLLARMDKNNEDEAGLQLLYKMNVEDF